MNRTSVSAFHNKRRRSLAQVSGSGTCGRTSRWWATAVQLRAASATLCRSTAIIPMSSRRSDVGLLALIRERKWKWIKTERVPTSQ
jgi:hypothetical protein